MLKLLCQYTLRAQLKLNIGLRTGTVLWEDRLQLLYQKER